MFSPIVFGAICKYRYAANEKCSRVAHSHAVSLYGFENRRTHFLQKQNHLLSGPIYEMIQKQGNNKIRQLFTSQNSFIFS